MRHNKNGFAHAMIFIILGLLGVATFTGYKVVTSQHTAETPGTTQSQNTPQDTSETTARMVDLTKLPLGDDRHSSTPKVGYIMTCQSSFSDAGGAFKAGPWIDQSAGTWDATQKIAVSGNISHPDAKQIVAEKSPNLSVNTNALPNHVTGVFPIASSDPAYQYDRNGSTIAAQDFNFSFPLVPTVQATPGCIRGEVGVTLSGAILFDGFDAGGRDAVAWELQDKCGGHPNSIYHYHGHSPCIPDKTAADEHSALIGYAFDGFGIFGTKAEKGIELRTADLDECHGHSHEVTWHSKKTSIYHYHMTRDFPYSVSCFKGKNTVTAPLAGPPRQSSQPPSPAGAKRP